MLLQRKLLTGLLVSTLAVSVSGCGFTPIHSKNAYSEGSDVGGEAVTADLSSIKVAEINLGRSGQQLRTELENVMNPMQAKTPPAFRLEVSLAREKQAQLVEIDREITRYKMIATARYRLIQLSDGKEVYHNNSVVSASFDAVTSDFSTYTAEEDTFKRLMAELARVIRFKLAAHLMDLPQAAKMHKISGSNTSDPGISTIGGEESAPAATKVKRIKRTTTR